MKDKFKSTLQDKEVRFSTEHTALLVVDMQVDFCHPEGHFARAGRDVSSVSSIIPNLQQLLAQARKNNVFIVYLQQVTWPKSYSDNDAWLAFKTRDGKSAKYTLLGGKGVEIVSELAPEEDEVIVQKYRPSAFHGTFLDQILRANGIRSVLVTGTNTEGCVMSTVLDSSFHDYYTGVVHDGVATSYPEMQEIALKFMETRYQLLSTEEIINLWSN